MTDTTRYVPDGYRPPEELPDDDLLETLHEFAEHWRGDALTEEQADYYHALKGESLKRMSTGGEHADYSGPDAEAEK